MVCFFSADDLTLARMTVDETRKVIDVWADQFTDLKSRSRINYVQIFENRGAAMGASNPHPHLPDLGEQFGAERAAQRASLDAAL